MVEIPQFTAPSYGDRTLNEVQRCVNLSPEKTPSGWALVSTPGLYSAIVFGATSIRGAYYASTGDIYTVHDGTCYQITGLTTATSRGSVGGTTGLVLMADNGTQLFIVETTTGAKYTLTMASGSVTAVADANCPSCSSVTFQDGYFIVSKTGTGLFYLSQLLDGTDWTPIQFATAESEGDILVGVYSNGEHLYLVGKKSIEIWYNTGNPSFPFERINGATQHIGCFSLGCMANHNGRLYIYSASVSGVGSIYEFSGTNVRKITTPYIESLLDHAYLPSIFSFAYHTDGHDFLQVTVADDTTYPSLRGTYVYDIGQELWFQKESNWSGTYKYDRLRFVVSGLEQATGLSSFAFDIAGDMYALGGLGEFPVNTENGTSIRRMRIFGPVESGTKTVFHSQIRIEAEVKFDAVGTTSVSATLDWTDDGGRTYSTARTLTKTTVSSVTGQRVLFTANQLGSSASRYYRLTLIGPAAKLVLKKCEMDLKEGRF